MSQAGRTGAKGSPYAAWWPPGTPRRLVPYPGPVTVHHADAAQEIVAALRPLGTRERAAQEKRYLKSDLEFWGVSVPDIRRVVTAAVRQPPGLARDEAIEWALELWREPVHERRTAAVELLRLRVAVLQAADLVTIETLIRASA